MISDFIKNILRRGYALLPEGVLKKHLAARVFGFLSRAYIVSYRYRGGHFEVFTRDGVCLRAVQAFDPEPLRECIGCCPLQEGQQAMDLGANMGAVTIYLAHRVGAGGRVWAFEPDTENFRVLQENLRLNRLEDRVVAVPKGLWDREGTLSFHATGNYTSSFVETDHVQRVGDQAALLEVPVTTLDAVVRAIHPARLDWIKIDIEGSETQALQGALETLKRFRPGLLIESHCVRGTSNAPAIRELLESVGYRVRPVAVHQGLVTWAAAWPTE